MAVRVTRQENLSQAPLNPWASRAAEQALTSRDNSAQPLVTVEVAAVLAAREQPEAARSAPRSVVGPRVVALLQAATRRRTRMRHFRTGRPAGANHRLLPRANRLAL